MMHVEPYALGQTVITYTADDGNGNTSTCTQTVTVEDNEVPSITCPSDLTVNTDSGLCTASGVALGIETTSDNCGVVTVTSDAVEPYAIGQTVITYTADDGNGNSSTCTQSVTVEDNEAPSITCPSDLTVSTDAGLCTASGVTLGSETTSDNCGVVTVSNDASEPYALGQTLITYTADDGNGNTSSCTQSVTVEDNEVPSIACPSDLTVDTDAGLCTASGVALGAETTSDNCGVVTVTNDAVEPYAIGQTLITYTADDGNGNTSSCTQSVTVEDNKVPSIVCPSDLTVDTDSGLCTASGVALGAETTSDNCGVVTVTSDAVEPYALGQTVITYTADDGNGNTSTCTQTVTVEDNEVPSITCPSDLTVDTDSGLCTASGVALGIETTSDNCGVIAVTNDASEPYALGQTVITYTADDGNGNTSSCTQSVTVEDNEVPSITCPSDLTVNTDAGVCTASGVALGIETTSDNCGVVTVTSDAVEPYALGQTLITYTADDGNGNTSSCTQTVSVEDNEAPSIACPSDLTVNTDAGLCTASGVALGAETTSDNCGVVTVTNDAVEPYAIGQTVITYTADDGNGNTSSCTQSVTVEDNEVPSIVCPSDLTVDTDSGLCTASGVALGSETTSDNCGVVTVTNDAVEPYALGQTVITYIADDGNGNTSICTQSVTVEDNEVPSITCPSDLTVNTDAGLCTASGVALGSETTSDNCGVVTVTSDAVEPYALGQTLITYTADDGNGNTSTCTQTVTVEDNEAPSITCPSDLTVNTDAGLCSASGVALGIETTIDNCGVVTVTNDAVEPYAIGQTVITYTADDGNGNTSTCTQSVTVEDNEAPSITCPSDLTVDTDSGLCTASGVALGSETTSDNCGVVTVTNDAVEPYALGQTVITYTADDGNGNTSTCTQTVTVEDNEAPSITCPADLTVNTDSGLCTASGVVLGSETTSDNCGVVTVINDASEPYAIVQTVITYTADDGNGNTSTCTQTVTVEDNEVPSITCPSDLTVNTDSGLCTASGVVLGIETTSDNCGVVTVSNNSVEPYAIGQTLITYTADDGNGNTSTCTQSVTVEDSVAPVIVCPADLTVDTDAGLCTSSSVDLGPVSISDNCGLVGVSDDAIEPYLLGQNLITYTAADSEGNTSSCTQTVTVEDNEAPSIACPSDLTVDTDAGLCSASGVALGSETTSDNCGVVTVTNDAVEPYAIGQTVITYTADDGNGNTSSCTQTVSVEDNEAPSITCPSDLDSKYRCRIVYSKWSSSRNRNDE